MRFLFHPDRYAAPVHYRLGELVMGLDSMGEMPIFQVRMAGDWDEQRAERIGGGWGSSCSW